MLINNTTVDRTGLSSQVRLLEGFGLSFVLLVSVVLNLAVCTIIWRTKVLRNKPANTFVANLCIANLLLTACVIPFSLVTIIRDEHAAYSRVLCQVRPNLYNCVLKISKILGTSAQTEFLTLGLTPSYENLKAIPLQLSGVILHQLYAYLVLHSYKRM